ncbi:hypothetical protein IQ07DRAFT_71688 [Pyrenochaeta sp. DS3sAY3a]|nr:hypothetical protein IQ07DRAFT_71688 [Pyrenochaeta sp. DS3sAY3a]
MKFAVISLLAASLASTNVGAAPTPSEAPGTSPNLVARDFWDEDECFAHLGGTVVGGRTLWMLRNTWNNVYGGNFSGRLGVRRLFHHHSETLS